MNLDGLVVNRYSKMCFPIGVGMKESTTKDYKVINEEIFNPIAVSYTHLTLPTKA